MTYEEKRDLLDSYRSAWLMCQESYQRVKEFRERNAGVKAILYTDMPKGSPVPKDLSDYAAQLDDLEAHVWLDAKLYERQARRVKALILGVKDPDYRRILQLRYLDWMSFGDIADVIGYSYRQTRRIHRKAVDSIDI